MRPGEDGGAVERGIQGRIRRQREEKEEGGDTQQESDEFVQTPVLGWRKNLREKFHVAATAVSEQSLPTAPLQGQSLTIMTRSGSSYNAGNGMGWRVGYGVEIVRVVPAKTI